MSDTSIVPEHPRGGKLNVSPTGVDRFLVSASVPVSGTWGPLAHGILSRRWDNSKRVVPGVTIGMDGQPIIRRMEFDLSPAGAQIREEVRRFAENREAGCPSSSSSQIDEGTNEIRKNVIARELVGQGFGTLPDGTASRRGGRCRYVDVLGGLGCRSPGRVGTLGRGRVRSGTGHPPRRIRVRNARINRLPFDR
jgi:hypothetical protein